MTIEQLRKAGFKVRATHYRFYKHKDDNVYDLLPKFALKNRADQYDPQDVSPMGGRTRVEITPSEIGVMAGRTMIGEAECSIKDNYNRKYGVQLAIDRAILSFINGLVLGL